jgi:hypothetical protein
MFPMIGTPLTICAQAVEHAPQSHETIPLPLSKFRYKSEMKSIVLNIVRHKLFNIVGI